MLIGAKRLDEPWLQALAANSGVARLSIASEKSAPAAVALWEGRDSPALAFAPLRPGDRLAAIIGPALLLSAALFCGLLHWRLLIVARRLQQSDERAERLASHDALSGLPNRRLFDARFDAAMLKMLADKGRVGILFIDLDRFKEINDSFGHEAGDRLICAVAARVGGILRPGDTLARLGGDEFAVICCEVKDKAEVEDCARRILAGFAEPFDLSCRKILTAASIGVAVAPDDSTDRGEIAQLADIALYRAKNEGRNRYRLYDQDIGVEQRRRLIIERELRNAIETDQLTVAYQPIYAADARQIVGVETLLRWFHPVLGDVPPNIVVSVAEERGLIVALGQWVLRRACLDAANWRHLKVAVNVSPIQFRQRQFVADVERILRETAFEPTRLELELTEGVIVSDADLAEESMMNLRSMGVRMALDDFGTGYSSLIYLRRFPFDKIKIDRSFLDSVEATGESRVLIDSVVNLGRALGLTVTAEGVETPEQLKILQSIGCHELQGYLMSRPVNALAITALLARGGVAPATSRAVA